MRTAHATRLTQRAFLGRLLQRAGRLGRATTDAASVFRACADFLAAGNSRALLLNLEELWGETEPQNLPGTASNERPNWRRRAQYSMEEFSRLPAVMAILRSVRRLRRRRG